MDEWMDGRVDNSYVFIVCKCPEIELISSCLLFLIRFISGFIFNFFNLTLNLSMALFSSFKYNT